uniref:Uncharacterized protein n=2 Tax=unclassified bacterial viruses TaxID=12333 RepID=A0AAU7J7T8_9VIRU
MTACTLGRGLFAPVVHPGPVVAYTWRDSVIPAWLVEEVATRDLSTAHPLEREVLTAIRNEAVPIRDTIPPDGPIQIAGRIIPEPLDWIESNLRLPA